MLFLSSSEYRESLRRYHPKVYVQGCQIDVVADAPQLVPGINGIGLTYDFALDEELSSLMRASGPGGEPINRMLAIPVTPSDLLAKLEAVRLVCQYTGCAQRYLAGDALSAIFQTTHRLDAEKGTEYHSRFRAYLDHVYAHDLTLGIAMTDAKGVRSLRPHQQPNSHSYVHIVESRSDGIVISGTKAIVTGAPYVHEFLVMPGRNMTADDAAFAVCCAVPVDAEGITIVARPAGRPGEATALFSNKYGQSTGVVFFEQVFVPWERVFLAGEWEQSGFLTSTYATHHRHTCIAARAGFGDLLIGAGALMSEANGLDAETTPNIREQMIELIKIVEGFYACGVAASVYATEEPGQCVIPDPIFANIGKLLLATQIYDMHRLAHELSGGLIVTLPGPEEDHNPATAGRLSEVLSARSDIPYAQRAEVARFIEDLTASYQGGWYSVISLHGGGSPEAMRREIYRTYPIGSRVDLVERLLERGVGAGNQTAYPTLNRQPGRCCATGCLVPQASPMARLPGPGKDIQGEEKAR